VSKIKAPPRSLYRLQWKREMGSSSKDDSGSDAEASSGDKTPSNSSLFSEGERVLAYHGPRIYEAKASLSIRSFLFYFFYLCPMIL
jgi:mortality factor 4-like protein 1